MTRSSSACTKSGRLCAPRRRQRPDQAGYIRFELGAPLSPQLEGGRCLADARLFRRPVGSIEEGVRVRGERAVEPALRLRPCRVIAADISGVVTSPACTEAECGRCDPNSNVFRESTGPKMAIRDIGLPLRPASRRVLNFHRKYSVLALGRQ